MPLTQLAPPYPIFTDKNGDPLDAGFIYFGVANDNPETNPITVYYDRGLTQTVAQPVRTSNGYIMRNGSPALIYADSNSFSVTVRNKRNELVIYSPTGYGVTPGIPFAVFDNAAKDVATLLADTHFTYNPAITGTVQVSPGDILRTLAEGFSYEVAASGATDEHVTTAGGVKLYVLPLGGMMYLSAFGAPGDAVTNAAPMILAAVAAAQPDYTLAEPIKLVAVDGGEHAITTTVTVSGEKVRFVGRGGVFMPRLGDSAGNVFRSASGILEFDGVEFDGGNFQPTAQTNNTVVINAGDTASYMQRVRVANCRFRNLNAVGGPSVTVNLLVCHLINIRGAEDAFIEGNECDTISGAATFLGDINNLREVNNVWRNTQWYSTYVRNGVSGLIEGNTYDCQLTTGVYWGGFINTTNDAGEIPRNSDLVIRGNLFQGYVSYGGVIRCQSDDNITIENNWIGQIQAGSLDPTPAVLTGIRVLTRTPGPGEPPQRVKILNNHGLYGCSGGTARPFIYVTNEYGSTAPIIGVEVRGNTCRSPSANDYWTQLALFHGLSGGMQDVRVFDNDGEIQLTTSTPVGGGIGFIANSAGGAIDGVQIGGNRVKILNTAVSTVQTGIFVSSNANNVRSVRPNKIINAFHGMRTASGSGPALEYLDDQTFESCSTNTVFSVPLSLYALPLVVSTTYDPPSILAGDSAFTDVTVTGAALGDYVEVSFSLNPDGVIFSGYVRVANSVRVYLHNQSGSTRDLASGTLRVKVSKS